MGRKNPQGNLFTAVIKVNTYSIVLASLTAVKTDLAIGIVSLALYIHLIAAIPYILDLESFSEKKILAKLAEAPENFSS